MPNSNFQQKSTPDTHICHQQAGRWTGRYGLLCRHLAWMPWGQSDPNCGIARQKVKRERENYPGKSPNLRHFLAHSHNIGLSTGQLAGCALAGDREAGGGSQSQKGAISAPEGHPLQNRKQAPICLPRLLGILGGWHSQGGSQPGISSPEETHGIPETGTPAATQETEWLGWRRW